jgi:hypothetical protein
VADALDLDHQSKVKDLSCKVQPSRKLAIHVTGKGDISRELRYARDKAELMNEVYRIETIIQ